MQITLNGEPCELSDRTTVADLLQQLRIEPRQVAVEINRELVPRTQHDRHLLAANDTVEIVTLVGGG